MAIASSGGGGDGMNGVRFARRVVLTRFVAMILRYFSILRNAPFENTLGSISHLAFFACFGLFILNSDPISNAFTTRSMRSECDLPTAEKIPGSLSSCQNPPFPIH